MCVLVSVSFTSTEERGLIVVTVSVVSKGEGLEFSITYHLEGVKCTEVLSSDYSVCLKEITQKMRLMMGLAKGKVLTSKLERVKA